MLHARWGCFCLRQGKEGGRFRRIPGQRIGSVRYGSVAQPTEIAKDLRAPAQIISGQRVGVGTPLIEGKGTVVESVRSTALLGSLPCLSGLRAYGSEI
jgi:hypothetical protein